MGRQHHIADPDGGGQALGKGIDIYYPLRFIYTLKGWDRARRKAEFRVVIILDYIVGGMCGSPAKQFIAAAHGCDNAGRVMVGGGYMCNIRTFLV